MKDYCESTVLLKLKQKKCIAMEVHGQKIIYVPLGPEIGNHTWGLIDFLCNFKKYYVTHKRINE